MYIKLSLIIGVLFFVRCSNPTKEKDADSLLDRTAIPVIEKFFEGVKMHKPSQAIDNLLQGNPNINLTDSSAISLKQKFTLINDISGEYKGFMLLKKKFIKDDIGVYSYLAKYEKRFYRFVFVFYNNEDSIRLFRFLFDEDIDDELENALRFYLE